MSKRQVPCLRSPAALQPDPEPDYLVHKEPLDGQPIHKVRVEFRTLHLWTFGGRSHRSSRKLESYTCRQIDEK
jgi:hypothetical protein